MERLAKGTLLPGESLAGNRQAGADAARQGLASVGMAVDSKASSGLDPNFSPAQKDEITKGCFTLLLVLADAMVLEPLVDQSPTDRFWVALQILDRAAELGPPTRAYHL